MNESQYQELIKDWESQIRAGNAKAVIEAFEKLKFSDIPRASVLPLANLARRTGMHVLGLRLLSSVIERGPSAKNRTPTHPAELAEYAILLHRNGALDEAIDILESLDEKDLPTVLLYRAFCYFNEFNHRSAIEVLEKYVQQEKSAYMNLVGHVNLAAAYVLAHENKKAFELLDRNMALAKAGDHKRLMGNCLELRAQLHLRERDFSNAQNELNSAANLLREFENLDFLWLQKWQAYLEDLQKGQVEKLVSFSEIARQHKSWENVRDADRLKLMVSFDPDLFDFLIFGTPYLGYRQLIYQETGKSVSSQHFRLGDRNADGLDLATGEIKGKVILKPGKHAHRLLTVLASDFYSPFQVGGIFNRVFENEYFDIFTSPNRIHQLVRRTRKLLKEHDIPIQILQIDGSYQLSVPDSTSLCIPLELEPVDAHQLKWKDFADAFRGRESISALEARTQLRMSRTSFQRFANWALEKGLLKKSGEHRATLYHLVST